MAVDGQRRETLHAGSSGANRLSSKRKVDPSSRALPYLKLNVGAEVRRSSIQERSENRCDWITRTRRCEVVHATLV